METGRVALAVRVLDAICSHTEPRTEDAAALRKLAESAEERNMPLDDLACTIIQRERTTSQSTGGGEGDQAGVASN